MKDASDAHDVYMNTVDRLEPDIHPIDPGAFYASAAISLKRIADELAFAREFAVEAMKAEPEAAALLKRLGYDI